jgi:hypothetical protein
VMCGLARAWARTSVPTKPVVPVRIIFILVLVSTLEQLFLMGQLKQ